MKKIEFKEIEIKGEKRIAILFFYDEEIIEEVKKIEGRKWEIKRKYWHVP